MAKFFDANSIVDLLNKRAKAGYKIRVFFVDLNSLELKTQEMIENKPGELQLNIKRNTNRLKNKFKSNKNPKSDRNISHEKFTKDFYFKIWKSNDCDKLFI